MGEQILDRWGVELYLNKQAFERGLKEAGTATQRFNQQLKRYGDAIGKWSQRAFLGLSGLAAATLGAVNRQETALAKARAVFRQYVGEVETWSKNFGEQFQVASTELIRFAAQAQDLFVPMGLAREEATRLSKSVVELSAKIALFNGQPTELTLSNIMSGLVGVTRTVRQYGILLSEARVNQEIMNQGWATSAREITEQHKVLARLNLMIADSGDAMSKAHTILDGVTGQFASLRKSVTELREEAGKAFIPTLGQLVNMLKALNAAVELAPDSLNEFTTSITTAVLEMTALVTVGRLAFGPAGAFGALMAGALFESSKAVTEWLLGVRQMKEEVDGLVAAVEAMSRALGRRPEQRAAAVRVGERALAGPLERARAMLPAYAAGRPAVRTQVAAQMAGEISQMLTSPDMVRAFVQSLRKLSEKASEDYVKFYLELLNKTAEERGAFVKEEIDDILQLRSDLEDRLLDYQKENLKNLTLEQIKVMEGRQELALKNLDQQYARNREVVERVRALRERAIQEERQLWDQLLSSIEQRQRRIAQAQFRMEELALERHAIRRRDLEERAAAAEARGHGAHARSLRQMAGREELAQVTGRRRIAGEMLARGQEMMDPGLVQTAKAMFENMARASESVKEFDEHLEKVKEAQEAIRAIEKAREAELFERMEKAGAAVAKFDEFVAKQFEQMEKNVAGAYQSVDRLGEELTDLFAKRYTIEEVNAAAKEMREEFDKGEKAISSVARALNELKRIGTVNVRLNVEGMSDSDVAALASRMSSHITREQEETETGISQPIATAAY